ncbi:carboxypeptidase-like regulatory domain-containing protein [Blastopirellula sp. JC732]|uniref:Carboxypeptidase-like regulatory domain-containing protein n=1 Tax=Blastopirellula sediminis TaxID=2894196 RepID=A0A9X1MN87_9BACT|nr:carboxypeptidase-like regulatory domain-containing protein [Blastopirellula sediminis]MCC9607347.1 carboxypeptidase-like regulatory domain-containing protein [Blastopirellula sediminis]MCC9629360.1 carboxypeptidase-like regulatory domain-containing protein [Blastopirellula sediminis]
MIQRTSTAALIAATLLAGGCFSSSGPGLHKVTGTVTKDGVPFVGASVEFSPVGDGATSYGHTDESGNFSLFYSTGKPGAVPGTHRVEVIGGAKAGTAKAAELDPQKPAPAPVEASKGKTIEAVVGEGGNNHIEIEL